MTYVFPQISHTGVNMTRTGLNNPQQTLLNNDNVASVRIITITRDCLHY